MNGKLFAEHSRWGKIKFVEHEIERFIINFDRKVHYNSKKKLEFRQSTGQGG